ncbi:nitronate monooxygenase [Kribbella hippodromi]|uniref:nitronate monooxygenase n=1 Tax=Kribbella hippodromi TaxID=434347 RepID=UPI0031D56492
MWAAPMAGGPSTVALVVAAARAGGLGFLAGGYKTPDVLAAQIAEAGASGVAYGVNLFAPNPIGIERADFVAYADVLRPEADRYGITLGDEPRNADDDGWDAKLQLLLAARVPVVSFTFGLPEAEAVRALQEVGSVVAQTVTTHGEAVAAADLGADLLIVQAPAAGGHSATFTPEQPLEAVELPELVSSVRQVVALPIVAAGGIASSGDTAAALKAGARTVMVGTALLRTQESGASEPHKAALIDPQFSETALTRAFTGRPARGLRNYFINQYEGSAPLGYPAIHHLTSPLRKAATAANDTTLIHLWAGTGYQAARAEPAATALKRLAPS